MNARKILGLAGVVTATLSMSAGVMAAKGGNGGANKTDVAIVVADGVYGTTTSVAVVMADDASALAASVTGSEYWIRGQCIQNGTIVYEQHVYTTNSVATLQLGPTAMWTGDDAGCTADIGFLRGGKWVSTASTPFTARGS